MNFLIDEIQKGISFEIFEKRGPEVPRRDWGVTVHWAVEFLELYPEEIVKQMKTAQAVQREDDDHQEFSRFYDGGTGERIKDIPQGPAKRFSQGRIRRLLAESLPIQVLIMNQHFCLLLKLTQRGNYSTTRSWFRSTSYRTQWKSPSRMVRKLRVPSWLLATVVGPPLEDCFSGAKRTPGGIL